MPSTINKGYAFQTKAIIKQLNQKTALIVDGDSSPIGLAMRLVEEILTIDRIYFNASKALYLRENVTENLGGKEVVLPTDLQKLLKTTSQLKNTEFKAELEFINLTPKFDFALFFEEDLEAILRYSNEIFISGAKINFGKSFRKINQVENNEHFTLMIEGDMENLPFKDTMRSQQKFASPAIIVGQPCPPIWMSTRTILYLEDLIRKEQSSPGQKIRNWNHNLGPIPEQSIPNQDQKFGDILKSSFEKWEQFVKDTYA